jgi:hypothetical protein
MPEIVRGINGKNISSYDIPMDNTAVDLLLKI